jgi:hypothetical protein
MNRYGCTLAALVMLACATTGSAQARSASRPLDRLQRCFQAPEELPLAEAVRRASVDGKYRTLLCVIRVPEDLASYSAFRDYGFSSTPSWGGFSGLPTGHWVYVYPYWFIWKEASSAPTPAPNRKQRAWGPEQATGEPDTEGAGDLTTAWASRTPDGQDEWLLLEYDRAIVPVAVIVCETFNPGALSRITMFRPDTEEVEVWKGSDPIPPGRDRGIAVIPVAAGFTTDKIKLFLDSRKVPGWNEIDAVGLIDEMGKTHWAIRAQASSTYAQEAPASSDRLSSSGNPRKSSITASGRISGGSAKP